MLCPSCKKLKEHYKQGYCVFCYEALYGQSTGLKTIDSNFVNELRIRGRRKDADKLLHSFQNNLRLEKETTLKIIKKQDIEIKKAQGYCSNIHCHNKTIDGFLRCEKCRKYVREYNKRRPRM